MSQASSAAPVGTVYDQLRNKADVAGDHLAFVNLRDGTQEDIPVTYFQLHQRCCRLAAALGRRSVNQERVLILLPQGVDFVVGFLGTITSGAIAVPAHTPRRNKRSWATFEAIVADCEPTLILTNIQTRENLLASAGENPIVEQLNFACLEELELEAFDTQWQPPVIVASDVAFLQYTSGSTKKPKGVMVSHQNLLHNAHLTATHMGHDQNTVIVSWLPLFHDLGLIGIAIQTVYVGATCYMMSPAAFSGKPVLWLQAISRYRACTTMSSDFGYRLCTKLIRDEQLVDIDLSCWKNALNAAEPIHASTLHDFTRRFTPLGFSAQTFFPAYGMAEATLLCTTSRVGELPVTAHVDRAACDQGRLVVREIDPSSSIELVSSGRPASDMDIKIVNPDTLERCTDGEMGEIWVAGASIARGYWRNAEETAKTFHVPLAGVADYRYLRTGDIGALLGDELFVTGRLKDLIIIRGRNVYPQDVELTVRNSHAAFAVVNGVAFSIEQGGEERLVIVQEVDRVFRKSIDVDELKAIVREAIWADHDIQVADIVLINRASLPKTTSGKVQRNGTRQAYLDGSLVSIDIAAKEPVVTARHDLEAPVVGPSVTEQRAALASEHVAWVRDYASQRLNIQLIDGRRMLPPYVAMDLAERGLMGTLVPKAYGGQDLGYVATLRVIEQMAAIDLTFAHYVLVHSFLGTLPVLLGGNAALKDEVLPQLASGRRLAAFALTEPGAGSNPLAVSTTASVTANGVNLSGEKCYSGHASWAAFISVFAAEVDERGNHLGISGFLVRQGEAGLKMGKEAMTMGMRGMVQSSFSLADTPVADSWRLGAPGEGMKVAQPSMTATRLPIAVAALGTMKRCVQLMHRYSSSRQVASGRLLDNPATVLAIKEIVFQIAEVKALVYGIAERKDAGTHVPIEVLHIAKIVAPEYLGRAVDRLVQVLGGRGYTENNIASQMMRDARVMRIFEGPTETLQAHLGAKLAHDALEFDHFLRHTLNQPALADLLKGAIEQATRLESMAPFERVQDQKKWSHNRIAETACRVGLHAFLLSSTALLHDPQRAQIITWSELLLDEALLKLTRVTPLEQRGFAVADIESSLGSYLADIGDVDMSLPGEEWELDPLLRRNPAPAVVTKPSKPAVVNTVVEPVADLNLLPWLLAKIAELAELPVDAVSARESFGALGVDSVIAAQLAAAITDYAGLEVDPPIFWHFPTPEKLIAHLGESMAVSKGVLVQQAVASEQTTPSAASSLLARLRAELI
ncbi:AMP-binding protein [Pseudomonas coronafaciens]|uniref:AMP-binding protein n=1 Tax=Pseudomonas coronafaciens TaxID=53409 RepID=UPI000EFFF41D|nr:AMP-binding protein [Pseudomonas coronafaciens]